MGRGQKKSEKGEGRRSERDGKEETTDNPLLKNLRGRGVGSLSILIGYFSLFRQQVSRHDGISSFSIVMTACSFD